MKKLISTLLLAAMLLGCIGTLAGCAPKDAGAQISVYLGDAVYDFDPTEYYVSDNAAQLMSLLYEPLFSLKPNGKTENAAARRYHIDKTNRCIVIELRESYWSDGTRVYARDFVYAWSERILAPSLANPAATLFYGIDNAIEVKNGSMTSDKLGIYASGAYEITIRYREGADPEQILKNLASVATAPVRQSAAGGKNADVWSKSKNTILTNGPFVVDTLNYTEGKFTLARNVGYHQPTTTENYTKNVTPYTLISFWDPIGDEVAVSYDQLVNETVFYMGDAPLAELSANRANAKTANALSTYTYVFNQDIPLFSDPHIRYALSLALDRGAMATASVFGVAASGFHPTASTSALSAAANVALANEELAKADQTKLGSKSFTLTVNDDERSIAMANVAVQNWAAIGFTVTVKPVGVVMSEIKDKTGGDEAMIVYDSAIQQIMKEVALGNRTDSTNAPLFEVIGFDFQMHSADPFVALSMFTTDMNGCGVDYSVDMAGVHRKNIAGFDNDAYDESLRRAITATADERTTILQNAEKLLIEQGAVAPVIFNQSFYFASGKLSGLKFDGFGNVVFTKVSQKNYENYLPDTEE